MEWDQIMLIVFWLNISITQFSVTISPTMSNSSPPSSYYPSNPSSPFSPPSFPDNVLASPLLFSYSTKFTFPKVTITLFATPSSYLNHLFPKDAMLLNCIYHLRAFCEGGAGKERLTMKPLVGRPGCQVFNLTTELQMLVDLFIHLSFWHLPIIYYSWRG